MTFWHGLLVFEDVFLLAVIVFLFSFRRSPFIQMAWILVCTTALLSVLALLVPDNTLVTMLPILIGSLALPVARWFLPPPDPTFNISPRATKIVLFVFIVVISVLIGLSISIYLFLF